MRERLTKRGRLLLGLWKPSEYIEVCKVLSNNPERAKKFIEEEFAKAPYNEELSDDEVQSILEELREHFQSIFTPPYEGLTIVEMAEAFIHKREEEGRPLSEEDQTHLREYAQIPGADELANSFEDPFAAFEEAAERSTIS